MGIIKDVVSGIQGAKAAKSAANAQQAAADQASAIQGEAKTQALDLSGKATAQARADMQPFTAAGTEALGGLKTGLSGLSTLVTDPNAQKDFITNNPFFEALSKQASTTLMNNQATKGKLGSGGTAEALQNSILLLGSDLVNQNITQRQNTNSQYQALVNTGLSAAGTQANATNAGAGRDVSTITGVANNQSDLRQDAGAAQAGGIMGAYNARQAAADNVEKRITQAAAGAGGIGGAGGLQQALALCDINTKENLEYVGNLNNGIPLYKFNYKDDDKIHINVIAQEAEMYKPHAVVEINGFKYVDMEKVCQ